MIHDVSPYGVHDMGGSVREFVEDDYLSAAMLGITTEEFVSTVALDGSPWVQSPRTDGRMIKGGHWAAAQPSFISAKGYVSNGYGSWSAGFRCAADL